MTDVQAEDFLNELMTEIAKFLHQRAVAEREPEIIKEDDRAGGDGAIFSDSKSY